MKTLVFHIIIILLTIHIGQAQSEYSSTDLQSFVVIYMDSKSEKSIPRLEQQLTVIMDTYDISHTRYRDLIHTIGHDKNIVTTIKEQAFLEEIQAYNAKIKKDHNNVLTKLCKEQSLSLSTYMGIRKQYKTNIEFQRALKPYFDTYLNIKK